MVKRIHTAVGMQNAGAVLYREFSRRNEVSDRDKAIRSSLFIPLAVIFAFGVEVGLKSLIEAQGGRPQNHHDLLRLYRKILPETRNLIERIVTTRVPELSSVETLLKVHRKSFETWRYLEDVSGPLVVPLETMAVTLEAILLAHDAKYGSEVAENREDSQPSEEMDEFVTEYLGQVFGSGPSASAL